MQLTSSLPSTRKRDFLFIFATFNSGIVRLILPVDRSAHVVTRLLIVSNRLPITATFTAGQVELEMSSGGLATGLKGPHRELGGLWIGYPGDVARLDPGQRERFENAL